MIVHAQLVTTRHAQAGDSAGKLRFGDPRGVRQPDVWLLDLQTHLRKGTVRRSADPSSTLPGQHSVEILAAMVMYWSY